MPLGLWKSKWEIHREDMTRFWAEMDRRHEEVQAQMDHRDREFEEEKSSRTTREAVSNGRWTDLQEKSDALRSDYSRELAEMRRFNTGVLLRMEKTYSNSERHAGLRR